MNGRPWSRTEIELLHRTIVEGGNTLALSMDLQRTHDALIAKARRLSIRFAPDYDQRPMVDSEPRQLAAAG